MSQTVAYGFMYVELTKRNDVALQPRPMEYILKVGINLDRVTGPPIIVPRFGRHSTFDCLFTRFVSEEGVAMVHDA